MSTIKLYNIQGMHCASCASIIERTIQKVEGVEAIVVNNVTENVKISFDETKINETSLNEKLEPLGYKLTESNVSVTTTGNDHEAHRGVSHSKNEKIQEIENMKKGLYAALPLAAISIFVMGWDILANYSLVSMMSETTASLFHHLLPIFATYIFATLGRPYILGVYRFFRYGKANMDTLIGIGTTVAFLYSFIITAFENTLRPFLNVEHTFYDVTIVVITFIALGKYLESKSKLKTGDAIEKLLGLQAKTALVLRDGYEIEIEATSVLIGDIVIIKPGQKIPVDGVVISGSSFVDESMITGEPIPVEKNKNTTVISGTINTSGSFTFKATKVGQETLLAHIVAMVEEAQSSKASIQDLADKISAVFVPVVLVIAFVSLGVWLVFGIPTLGFSQALSFGLTSFVGVLVIACPCALGLATPTAIIVGVGKGAREGILVKDASTLEMLHKATVVVVDKTGTITKGHPELSTITVEAAVSQEDVLSILASIESKSEHPISRAIVSYAKENNSTMRDVDHFEIIKGKGLKGTVDGIEYFAGNIKILDELSTKYDEKRIEKETKEGKTPVFFSTKGELLAVMYVSDHVKPEAVTMVKELHALGKKVIMLTGDTKNTGEYIAGLVGIDEVIAEVLPDEKLHVIQELQRKGHIVVMAGDGVNDAPALAQADVGIAMGTGTDVAIESAGITLLGGDISKLVKAIKLSKMTMRGIKQNLFWAFIYNIVGIPLAAGVFYPIFGWVLNPVFAGFAMAMSSVSVVSNSLRIKAKRL